MHQFILALQFYLVFFLFGLIGLAFTIRFTKNQSFLGYLFAKPLGIMAFSYPIWLLSSLHIVRFNNQPVILSLLTLALIGSLFALYKYNKKQRILTKKLLLQCLLIEVCSFLLFALFLYLRGYNPQIYDTERFMDMMMFMSAGKTDYFPFIDGWSAGKSVNYYYYGFYLFALINRLAYVPYSYGYTFALGLIFVMTVTLSFGVIYKVTKSILFSVLGAGFVSLAGNFHYASCYLNNLGKDIGAQCYFPKATRIYNPAYTINEFPMYSFALGDMHPHVMSIPFFLLSIYLIILFHKAKKLKFGLLFSLALSLSTAAMINTWDFITLGILFGFVALNKLYKINKKENFAIQKKLWSKIIYTFTNFYKKSFWRQSFQQVLAYWNHSSTFFKEAIKTRFKSKKFRRFFTLQKKIITYTFFLAISPFIFFLPFFLKFHSPVAGIGFVPTYVNYYNGTLFSKPEATPLYNPTFWDSLKKLIVGPLNRYQAPSSIWFLLGIYGAFLLFIIFSWMIIKARRGEKIPKIPLYLFLLSIILIIFTEYFFFGEMFHITSPEYFRANTVFKFGYHAWILMGLSSGMFLYFAWKQLGKIKSVRLGIFTDFLMLIFISSISYLIFIYTVFSVIQAYGPALLSHTEIVSQPCKMTNSSKKHLTLDGNYYLCTTSIDDLGTINWINENQKERVVIVEAAGGPYTYFARIGANTGMINIINWETHEWQWRFELPDNINNWRDAVRQGFNYSTSDIVKDINQRKLDVENIYNSENEFDTKLLLAKYSVKYIYIGDKEREAYPNLNADKFEKLGKLVFQSGESRLYQVYYGSP